MACEMATPSLTDVPRPTSSINTSESYVAKPRIIAVDAISLANVLKLFSRSSSLDRRVRSASWMLKQTAALLVSLET